VIDATKRVTKKPQLQKMERVCLLELGKTPPDQFETAYKKYLQQQHNTLAIQKQILKNIQTYI
jgi:hypothetical protein